MPVQVFRYVGVLVFRCTGVFGGVLVVTQTAVRGGSGVCVVHARPESACGTLSCGVSRVTLIFAVGRWSTRVAERR